MSISSAGTIFEASSTSLSYSAIRAFDLLRQRFIDQTVPQAELIGLKVPDPDLKWNEERESYDFGEIDWQEFWKVVSGDGPCNRQRLQHHIRAQQEGQWIRDAMHAYEMKRQARAVA